MELAAIVFIIFIIAVAVVTFLLLKKAIKMAIRAGIVFLILIIGIVGTASLWYAGSDTKTKKDSCSSIK